jgi:hypothetical protein
VNPIVIPAFPSFLILPLFMVIALLVAGTVRRKKPGIDYLLIEDTY